MRLRYVLLLVLICIVVLFYYRYYRQTSICDLYAQAQLIYDELEDRIQPQNATSPNEILPYLYVGDRMDAYNNEKLAACGITHILNTTPHEQRFCEHRDVPIIYAKMPAQDVPFFNISQYFDASHKFINDAHQVGGKVLVHCNAGVSRSAIIAANYIATEFNMNAYDSLVFVKKHRRKIRPNIGFIQQLLERHG